ncbi:MAG: hypothetical protein HQK65_21420 [Desulfamplus sp.]|nr:hypothetical protein [Desulfamplus sp.]
MSFESYFCNDAIIERLIHLRLKSAIKRNEHYFFRKITDAAPDPEELIPPFVDKYLPPRRSWKRPPAAQRKGLSPHKINHIAIRRTIYGYITRGNIDKTEWGENLIVFIRNVQKRIKSPGHNDIARPEIFLKKKESDPGCSGDDIEYRIMASYKSPEDIVIIGIIAKYFRDIFDHYLLPEVYSYRKDSDYTRSRAIEHLCEYRQRHHGQNIYVSECDLKKFFDTIDHDVAKNALNTAIEKAEHDLVEVDDRAVAIFNDYLGSYSFNGYAFPKATSMLKESSLKGRIARLEESDFEKCYSNSEMKSIGIPQGGAISTVISNLILDNVDRAVKEVVEGVEDPDLFYARYCDDMIIMHKSPDRCRKGLDNYMNAAVEQKLFYHDPKKIEAYNSDYYDHKSRDCYLWKGVDEHDKSKDISLLAADPSRSDSESSSLTGNLLSLTGDLSSLTDHESRLNEKKSGVIQCLKSPELRVPWVSFLGYQIKYNGQVRVRTLSIQKQKIKIKNQIEKLSQLLKKKRGIHCSKSEILERTRKRLFSMSTGRKALRIHYPNVAQPCWADAFTLINMNPDSSAQLRLLDRNRDRQLRFLNKKMQDLKIKRSVQGKKRKAMGKGKSNNKFGPCPDSYHGFFSSG